MALSALGRRREAEALQRETLTLLRRDRGETHPRTLGMANNLAVSLIEMGRPAEAEVLLRQVLAGYRATRGAEHPDTLNAMNS
eukprot:gene44459-biopygen30520